MPPQLPLLSQLEPVTVSIHVVSELTPLTIEPYAIDIAIVSLPAGTALQIETGGISFEPSREMSINSNNRPMANTWALTATGGNVIVLVSRVTGRPAVTEGNA